MPLMPFDQIYLPNANGTNQWISSGIGWYIPSTYANINQYPDLDTSKFNYARSDECYDSYGTNISLPVRDWRSFVVEVYVWAGFCSTYGALAIESTPTPNAWRANTQYYKGDVVLPTNPAGVQFRCQISGMTSSVEPTWSTTVGVSTADGSVMWVSDPRLYFGTVYPNPIDIKAVGTPSIQLGVLDLYYGNNQLLSESWRKIGERWGTNPRSGLAWTYNDIKYIRIGYRYQPRPGEGQVRVAQLYLKIIGQYWVN